jgi:glycine betaine/proline transport system ATP-binding protein
MQNEVIRLHHDLGKTMVFITHDLQEAAKVGDRIAIMRDGALIQVGTPEELVANPKDDYVANFVRDIAKSHVLTLKYLARPLRSDETAASIELASNTIIREATSKILDAHHPVHVVDNGKSIGVVSAEDVLGLIAGVN